MSKITVLENEISTSKFKEDDYISITDIAKSKNSTDANDIIRNWLRNRNTIEFLGVWETIYNPNFKTVEFDGFKNLSTLKEYFKYNFLTHLFHLSMKCQRKGLLYE
jgi:hypothetical protein